MAQKGESKIVKRFAAPKVAKVQRKAKKYLPRVSRGPHSASASVPITVVLRDLLHLADTTREVKAILNQGKVLVDGKAVRDHRYPIGFMDVISLPAIKKFYRIVYDKKGRIEPKEIDPKASMFKLCKITGKAPVKGGKTQVRLHDGKAVLISKKYAVGDVLKLELPTLKVSDNYPIAEGNVAYVTGGKHAGKVARIKAITKGTVAREPLAILEDNGTEFQTRKEYVFVLGIKEPAITTD